MNGHLRGVGPGDEVGEADEIQEALLRQPCAPPDHFFAHHGDVGGGATEGDGPELQEYPADLRKRSGSRPGRERCGRFEVGWHRWPVHGVPVASLPSCVGRTSRTNSAIRARASPSAWRPAGVIR